MPGSVQITRIDCTLDIEATHDGYVDIEIEFDLQESGYYARGPINRLIRLAPEEWAAITEAMTT